MPYHAISATDKWVQTFTSYQKDLNQIEGMYLNGLPYALLNKIENKMAKAWELYQPYAIKLAPGTDAKTFIAEISKSDSSLRIVNLLGMDKIFYSDEIKDCILNCASLDHLRNTADQDISKGFMIDLNTETLHELSKKILVSSFDWRLLADGLGFNNVQCRNLTSPFEMFNTWIEIHSDVTVERLYFEANQLMMKEVCRYLDAIPLEGVAKEYPSSNLLDPSRKVTRYELIHFAEIVKMLEPGSSVCWKNAVNSCCLEKNARNPELAYVDVLWKCLGISIGDFTKHFIETKFVLKLFEEFKSGIFEPKSPGGVTWAQVKYLAKALADIKVGCKTFFCLSQREAIDTSILNKQYFSDIHGLGSISFEDFLSLYWQDPNLGAGLTLYGFTRKIMDILKTAKCIRGDSTSSTYKILCTALDQAYHKIKPARAYDSHLAARNFENEMKMTTEKMKTVSEPLFEENLKLEKTDDATCRICMENPKNVVLVPCGHFGFCLECIKKLAQCPTCRTDIAQRVHVYDV